MADEVLGLLFVEKLKLESSVCRGTGLRCAVLSWTSREYFGWFSEDEDVGQDEEGWHEELE